MILCTQYYRPPFPERTRWQADFADIRRTGFDSVYLTAPWAWIEPRPDQFVFDDFDALIDVAGAAGLRVIVNLWAEVQPVWIHREIPDGSMIDHMGRAVVSSTLAYTHFGLTPGCCTDHPVARKRSGHFLQTVVQRYAANPSLHSWDCWNEMRWMSQADGFVCFCNHTAQRFRNWLRSRYSTLDQLNAAWKRRYCSWDDVQPAKFPARTYTDSMAWQAFLSTRTCEDLRWRYEQVRAADPRRPILAHASFPSVFSTGEFLEHEPALARGNDWELAQQVDGYGCSHFPAWIHTSPADFGARLESSRCATGDKPYWLSELQGGAAGHGMQAMEPVSGEQLTRWLWTGIARGAKAVNFWCWRDEVFGRESGGFGIVGEDGFRESRLRELRRTADVLSKHAGLLEGYRPASARIAVVFEPRAFQLDWASCTSHGLAPASQAPYPAGHSLQGYLRALERTQLPYDVLEPQTSVNLAAYSLLILPWPLVVDSEFGERVVSWVRAGGALLVEAGLDAFDAVGLYRYPDERPLAKALELQSEGRRRVTNRDPAFSIAGASGTLRATRWIEPWQGAPANEVVCHSLGQGTVIAVNTFAGLAYWEERYADFECFVKGCAALAGALPDVACDLQDGEVVQWRFGASGNTPLLFVINCGPAARIRWTLDSRQLGDVRQVIDLIDNSVIATEAVGEFGFDARAGGFHVLSFEQEAAA